MRITPDKFYCENDVPGMPAGSNSATLDWSFRESGADAQHDLAGLQAIADERQALQDAGRHIAAVGGFSNSSVGEFEAVGDADVHGGRRINVIGAPAVCSICEAPIRMID